MITKNRWNIGAGLIYVSILFMLARYFNLLLPFSIILGVMLYILIASFTMGWLSAKWGNRTEILMPHEFFTGVLWPLTFALWIPVKFCGFMFSGAFKYARESYKKLQR